jgi:hypothetical protein
MNYMFDGNYILDNNKNIVKCADFLEWAKWMQSNNRTIAKTEIGELFVSTVFLGIDHSFASSTPILFETMVFKGKHSVDDICERYATYDEALEGHNKIVKKLEEGR